MSARPRPRAGGKTWRDEPDTNPVSSGFSPAPALGYKVCILLLIGPPCVLYEQAPPLGPMPRKKLSPVFWQVWAWARPAFGLAVARRRLVSLLHDYRIGTAYMGEHINDNLKWQAMRCHWADLLKSDSVLRRSNISFRQPRAAVDLSWQNRRSRRGGLPFDVKHAPAGLHRRGEINALLDTPNSSTAPAIFMAIYAFVADTPVDLRGGHPDDPGDEGAATLGVHCLMVWIEGPESQYTESADSSLRPGYPKPMYYSPIPCCLLGRPGWNDQGVTADGADPRRCHSAMPACHGAPGTRSMTDGPQNGPSPSPPPRWSGARRARRRGPMSRRPSGPPARLLHSTQPPETRPPCDSKCPRRCPPLHILKRRA